MCPHGPLLLVTYPVHGMSMAWVWPALFIGQLDVQVSLVKFLFFGALVMQEQVHSGNQVEWSLITYPFLACTLSLSPHSI